MAMWKLRTEWFQGQWWETMHHVDWFNPGPTKTEGPLILVIHHGKPGEFSDS